MDGCDQGLQVGVVLHVIAHGMDEQQVLRLQGVGHCVCDQGGGEHDGLGSIEGVAGHDEQGLQRVSKCDGDEGGGEHDGLGSIEGGAGGHEEQGLQGDSQCDGDKGECDMMCLAALRCGWSC